MKASVLITNSRITKILLLFLFLYFLIGVTARLGMDNEEQVYLVSSWYLYSKVPPSIQKDFTVLVHQVGGKVYSPPLFIDDTQGIVFSSLVDYNHSLVHNVRDLGRAVLFGEKMEITRAQTELESKFITRPISYELVQISFNPIDRWKTGKILQSQSLAKFTFYVH